MRRLLLALALLTVTSCVVAPRVEPAKAPPPPPPPENHAVVPPTVREYPPQCNPVGVTTCGLPFPSNRWTRADATSPTGVRLAVPDELVPAGVQAQLPASLRSSAVFNASDGFSAAGPIIFELDRAVDANSLPIDGGNAFVVFDLDTGARVPIRALVDVEAGLRGAPGTIVRAYPRSRFPWKHHLVAALTTELRQRGGTPYAPSLGMQQLARSGSHPTLDFLAVHGIANENVLSVTDFTVRSQGDVTSATEAMFAEAQEQEHPVRNIAVAFNVLFGAAVGHTVTGEMLITDFRDGKGEVHYRPGDMGTGRWVDFMLTIPVNAPSAGAPVVVYGHGIGISKETALIVTGVNAQHGVATLAIDQPNHGSRAGADGGNVFDLVYPDKAGRLFGLVTQSSLDQASILKALTTSLASLDTAPPVLFGETTPDGRPDLDPTRIFYEGTSLGGVLGSVGVAMLPQYKGAAFQVTGAGITNDLADTIFWQHGFNEGDRGFRGVIPASATPGEAALLVAATQHVLDPGDAINYVDRLRAHRTPTLLPYALDDGTVNNRTTEAFAELAQLPIVGPVLRPVPFLPAATDIPDSGVAQLPGGSLAWMHGTPLEPLEQLLSHAGGVGEPSALLIGDWLRRRLDATAAP